MTKSRPSSSRPDRCQRITSSVTGKKRRFGHSAHLTRGFSHRPRDPLVGAGGRIAGLAGLAAFEAAGIDVLASAEERAKQGDLGFGRGAMMDRMRHQRHKYSLRGEKWAVGVLALAGIPAKVGTPTIS